MARCMVSRRQFLVLAAAPALVPAVALVASFSILGDLVRQISGGRIQPRLLVAADQDAHVFQPKPSDLRAVGAADVLVTNGLGFEGWMDRLAQAAGFKGRLIVASAGVTPRQTPDGQTDPHAFQSVPNIKRYVANLHAGLIHADPAGAAIYADAASRYSAHLDTLDAAIRAAWAPIPRERRRIITTHDALGYYGAEYGVDFFAPEGFSTESEPSARALRSLIGQISSQQITALFLENISNGALLKQIAHEAKVKIGGTLYSDALSPASGPASTYIALMQHNTGLMTNAVR